MTNLAGKLPKDNGLDSIETAELLTTLELLRAARRGDARLDFSEPSDVEAEED